MEVRPPKFAEVIVRWLLPPACVEHVLGDLQERMQGVDPKAAQRQYVIDTILTLPSVIFSQALRSLDLRLVCLYAVIQFGVFLGLHQHMAGTTEGLAKIWWFTVAAVVLHVIDDAYRPGGWFAATFLYGGSWVLYFAFTGRHSEAAIWAQFAGYFSKTFARWLLQKYFAWPRNRKTL